MSYIPRSVDLQLRNIVLEQWRWYLYVYLMSRVYVIITKNSREESFEFIGKARKSVIISKIFNQTEYFVPCISDLN